MTAQVLYEKLSIKSDAELIDSIRKLNNAIQLLFLRINRSENDSKILEQLFLNLNKRTTNDSLKKSEEFQSLLTHLALYFKAKNAYDNVRACEILLTDHVTKKRLAAYIFQRRYANWGNHITHFGRYIEMLSGSTEAEFDEYINEALADLHDYKIETIQRLNQQNETEIAFKFSALFEDKDLALQFPLLEMYQENLGAITSPITVHPYADKIYEPSDFTENLFNDKFINEIKYHEATEWHAILLGYDKFTIRNSILKFGQANFDKGFKKLSSSDVVKLYCFMNMRKHFFSSYSFFERSSIIKTYYKGNDRIKFIDIGCGPATSGIALIDYLYTLTQTNVLFDYYGIDCYKAMLDEARNMFENEIIDDEARKEFVLSLSEIKEDSLRNASCLIFNACYLFASPTLDVNHLCKEISRLRKAHPYTDAYFLYQNTTDPAKNINYQHFKDCLTFQKVEYSENVRIYYNNKRNNYFDPSDESIYFEILIL
jgi:hypothetical protein